MVLGSDFVYIALPRTASVSISNWLVEHYNAALRSDLYHTAHIPAAHAHKPVFTVVRNPYDRMVSLYQFVEEKFWFQPTVEKFACLEVEGCTLAKFVRWCTKMKRDKTKPQWWSQAEILQGVVPEHVLRFEQLPECLWKLPFARGGAVYSLCRTNATRKSEKPKLNLAAISAINQHSAADFDAFGYKRRLA